MIFNHVWSVIFFTSSNVSCCPVQKNGLGAIALFQGLQSKTHGPCTRHVWPFSRHVWPFSRFSFLMWLPFIFLASAHPSQLEPRKGFHLPFFWPPLGWSGCGRDLLGAALPLPLALGLAPLGLFGPCGLPPSELSVPSFPSLLLLLLLEELDWLFFVPAKSWL